MTDRSPPADQNMDSDNEPDERADLNEFSDDEKTNAPKSLNERRRAQKALFEAWLVSDAAQDALKPKTKHQRLLDADDEELSIQSLMSKQGSQIIKNPRQYQWELFERAKEQNTIAVLDTGSGKTLIAVLLLQWVIDQELEHRAAGKEPRISFFLVASVTLVHQQRAVLEANLDHNVGRASGADNVDNWNKAKWSKLFSENKVIVATADVLHQCLAHSYITMKQINLLIFDEAHHAKKDHAYARIIKDFYVAEPDQSSRPRIFGMTASPIDAKADVARAANQLESLLHSRIATTDDMSLTEAIKKPVEQMLYYPPVPAKGFETLFLRSVKARYPSLKELDKLSKHGVEIVRQLGRWCADHYLAEALSEKKLKRYEQQAEKSYYHDAEDGREGISQLDSHLAVLRQAVDFVATEKEKYAPLRPGDFSPKVIQLQQYLGYQFERPSEHRCIVFVEARHTARLLAAACKKTGTRHMRVGFLVGANSPDIDEDRFSYRSQVITLKKFHDGEINCLFSTSVAEEGLDVPDCNLVVRFDMYRTMIQYVQSRGRARKANSVFIHMLELGNDVQRRLPSEVRFYETAMRNFCQTLPENRRLTANEDHLEELLANEQNLRVYNEPSSGAKLTYGNALVYLANFVSAVPNDTEEKLHPVYVVSHKGDKFIAEVILPSNAPIHSAIGRVCTKKTLAKRSAAFEACLMLRKKEYLDKHLLPIYQKRLPAMRNALLAVNMKRTNSYTMRVKPSIWEQTRGTLPTKLWVTTIDLSNGLDHPHQPLAMLTRTPMPSMPSFPIYLRDSSASAVVSTSLSKPLQVGECERLQKLSAFTFRVFSDVFSKKYEQRPEQLSYWLAPVSQRRDSSLERAMEGVALDRDPEGCLDWSLLDMVYNNEEWKWTPQTPDESLIGRFLVDRWDGGRKFYSHAICPELKPQDPVPQGAAKAKFNESILGYSVSLFKKSREKATWNPVQPVIAAEKLLQRRDMLSKPDAQQVAVRTKAWLCPEPLLIAVLPPAVVETCFAWPAIIHRFESYLIALEACDLIGIDCDPATALESMTKDSDNSGDHDGQQQINFQRGMGNNYERLEFIGDTFLKTATSISTFIQNPNDNEFEFHVKRMLMLCNKNLFNVALDLKLYEFIRSQAFERRTWYPEGLNLLEGKGANKKDQEASRHSLGEKTIADVCEALIGAAFLGHDKPGQQWHPSQWDSAVRTVTKLVRSKDHCMEQWSDYSQAYEKPAYQTGDISASHRDLAEKVELEHPYHFNYPRLLRSAFLHPSMPSMYEKVPNYQRLEFLGDALLDIASIVWLFYRFPDKDPQWLTEHKMAMVSNRFLGAVSVNTGFYKHLRYSNSIIQHQIARYAAELLEAKNTAGTGRDYWTHVAEPPKCLPDIVEAYVGAMFIDSDFDYNVVQDFFDAHIKWYFEDMSIYDTFANNHPCTHLHNLLTTTYGCQDYRLMAKELPNVEGTERKDVVAAVMVHDEIVASSQGKSGRYARLRAAHQALEQIEGLAPGDFRKRFGCDCSLNESSEQEQMAPGDCSI
ncbi:dicer-like protein 1 [Hortaea werneckii]|nr:dicer-like protein 1 [Hortaea werneckii]